VQQQQQQHATGMLISPAALGDAAAHAAHRSSLRDQHAPVSLPGEWQPVSLQTCAQVHPTLLAASTRHVALSATPEGSSPSLAWLCLTGFFVCCCSRCACGEAAVGAAAIPFHSPYSSSTCAVSAGRV
jgi:hypothetical protein